MHYRVAVLGDSPVSGTILDLQIELPTVENHFKERSSSFDEFERNLQLVTSASLPIAQEAFNRLKKIRQQIFLEASITWKLATWTHELIMAENGSIEVDPGCDLYYRSGWAAARGLIEEQEPIDVFGGPETLHQEGCSVYNAIRALKSVYLS